MSAVAVAPLPCRPEDWECPGPLPPDSFAPIRRRMVLHQCKWDPQVGDVETIARHPIVLPGSLLDGLGAVAERLDAEGEAAAHELAGRPELVRRLGLPGCLARVLSDLSHDWTPAAARVVRFDFHPTTDGWRISEANSDVPGGFAESSHLPRLMAEHLSGTRPWGDPQDAIARAIQAAVNGAGRVALVAAPGYMEDQQVVAGLAAALREIGLQTWRGRPAQVTWTDGHARCLTPQGPLRLDAVVRFFQGEWLPRLSRNSGWQLFIRGGHTPVCNPGYGLLTESKRFPIVWDELKTPLPTWRAFLPETRDPRAADWHVDGRWLLKAAYANNGDEVADRTLAARRDWRRVSWSARLRPGGWAAQCRFTPLPLPTPAGPMYPCLGIYVVNGRAAGVYGRLSPRPLIDYSAIDVAVLVRTGRGVEELA